MPSSNPTNGSQDIDFEAAFKASLANDSTREKLNLSEAEVERFSKCFNDPEFTKLFSEYVDEISDPKHREEQEAYIRQLEGEQKTPEDKILIHPKEGFVAKLHMRREKKDEHGKSTSKSTENRQSVDSMKKEDLEKLFVNIVSSDMIKEPTSTKAEGGSSWSLPHTIGPVRMEKDKKGNTAPTFDVCFHPKALQLSVMPQFRDLVVQIAKEGIIKAFLSIQKEVVEVTKEYHVIRGVDYYRGTPATMMVGKEYEKEFEKKSKKNSQEKKSNEQKTDTIVNKGKLAASRVLNENLSTKGKIEEKGKANEKTNNSTSGLIKDITTKDCTELAKKGGKSTGMINKEETERNGNRIPKYTITERGIFDMADHMTSSSMKINRTRPKELVAKIELPLVQKASEIDLDIKDDRIMILDVPDVYHMEATLSYPVDDAKSKAKFDKTKKVLTLTIPVLPFKPESESETQLPQMQKLESSSLPVPPSTDQKESSSSSSSTEKLVSLKENAVPPSPPENEPEFNQKLPCSGKEENEDKPKSSTSSGTSSDRFILTPEMIEEGRKEALKRQEILDKVKSEEKEKMQQKGSAVASTKEESSDAKPNISRNNNKEEEFDLKLTFVESEKFEGKRRGFHFRTGDFGVGYYRDFSIVPEEKPKLLDTIEGETKSSSLTNSAISDTLLLNNDEEKEAEKLMSSNKQNKDHKRAVKEQETFTTPKYRHQQTLRSISMIIDVKDIEKESVVCTFENRRVKHKTEKSDTMNSQGETGYLNLTFYISLDSGKREKSVLEIIFNQAINPSECKYDVAANNMLLMIGKKYEGMWKSVATTEDLILLEKEKVEDESEKKKIDLNDKMKDLSIQGDRKDLKEVNHTKRVDLSGIKITNPRLFELD